MEFYSFHCAGITPAGVLYVPVMPNVQVQNTIRNMSRMMEVQEDAMVTKDDLFLTTDEMYDL